MCPMGLVLMLYATIIRPRSQYSPTSSRFTARRAWYWAERMRSRQPISAANGCRI